ncbi:MAG: glycosyltransferase [Acidobacteriota bacterium]|nr:glycosyltransferase [Acidobacteriota bacterium]
MPRGASIVCLSSIDWSFNWQIPQETAQFFAEGGNRVLFIENTGVRRAELRDAARLWTRLRNWSRAGGGFSRVAGNIDVFSPLLVPLPYSRAATLINTRMLVSVISDWLGKDGGGGPLIFITFLPTPLAREVISALRPALVIYYCVDSLADSSPGARMVAHSERKLLAEADLVLVTSRALFDMAASVARRVELLATGVRVEKFESARRSRAEAHEVFSSLPRPVVGFIGSVREATDLRLLASAAGMAPDLQFVLAGPCFVDVAPLAPLPNAKLFGAIPHEEVTRYMVRFDVGILPYSLNRFTAGIMPVKLKEYLAAGLPVVATPMPEVRRFAEQHPGLVRFASGAPQFVEALRAALSETSAELVEHRVSVARQYDWRGQNARMNGLIERALAES